jgi:lipocalin
MPEAEFKSHDWCQPGFYALKFDDSEARDLLWLYARRIRKRAESRSDDIMQALKDTGYDPVNHKG